MRNKYKHLFFDLDNTLFDFTASEHLVLRHLFDQNLKELNFTSFDEFIVIYNEINQRLWAEYRNHTIRKDDVKYGRFIKTLQHKEINNKDLACYLGDEFVKQCTESKVLVAGALEVVAKLSEKYQLHIVSNGFAETQYKKLELTGLRPYFKGITLSEEVKIQKPDRRFFEHALKNVNARKNESLVIGDNWECDIVGALNFGIEAIYFSYTGDAPKNDKIRTIFELNELLNILG